MIRQAQGSEIIIIEALEKEEGGLHPLQEAFIEACAIQYGFSNPGMILSSLTILEKNLDPTDEKIKEEIFGNLCRCTSYKQIIEAIKLAAEKMR